MRYLKYTLLIAALFVLAMYGWYLLANAVNQHADMAATAVIEDSLSTNAAYDIQNLRDIELRLRENDVDGSIELLQKLIEDKLWQLESCVSEQCKALQERRNAQ